MDGEKEFARLLPIEWAARFDWKSTSEGKALPSLSARRRRIKKKPKMEMLRTFSPLSWVLFSEGHSDTNVEGYKDISTSHLREIPRPT